jgi:hypothetical protein
MTPSLTLLGTGGPRIDPKRCASAQGLTPICVLSY